MSIRNPAFFGIQWSVQLVRDGVRVVIRRKFLRTLEGASATSLLRPKLMAIRNWTIPAFLWYNRVDIELRLVEGTTPLFVRKRH